MNITEISITSAINYNVQDRYRDIIQRFLESRYRIQAGELATQLRTQFATEVASHIKNSKPLFNAIYSQIDEKTKAETSIRDETDDKIDKLIVEQIDSGTIVLDETGAVITENEILDTSVELAIDKVAELPDFNIDHVGDFKVWISGQPLSDIISALNASNYDSLNERFNDSL